MARGKMKRIIFVCSILACFFQDTLTNTIPDSTQTKKSQKVKKFLDSIDIDQKIKDNIISYFNLPGAGTPEFIKIQPTSESTASLTPKSTDSLSGNPSSPIDKRYPKLKIDKKATAIAAELRKNININPDKYIPIFKNRIDEAHLKTRHLYITMNSRRSTYFPHTIPFRLAHEYAHIERNSLVRVIGATTLTQASLAAASFFLFGQSKNNSLLYAGAIGSIVLTFFAFKYFQRQEEKACDLRAIELIKSDKGIEEFFSYTEKPEMVLLFPNHNFSIIELKYKYEKPSEYTTWIKKLFSTHPSHAERVHYCKAFAKERGYI
jgi:Peptidase family M48